MRLDMYLFRRALSMKARMVMKLNNEDDKEQIGYWRKHYDLHSLFAEFREEGEDDNVTEIPLTKEDLEEIQSRILSNDENNYTKSVLKNAIENTDFDNEEVFYYAWY